MNVLYYLGWILVVINISITDQQPTQSVGNGCASYNPWIQIGQCATKSDITKNKAEIKSDLTKNKEEIKSDMKNIKDEIKNDMKAQIRTLKQLMLRQIGCTPMSYNDVEYCIHNNSKKTWPEAKKFCDNQYGGGLITISSEDKWQNIVDELKQLSTDDCPNGFWTSGHISNGTWVISEGVPVVESLWAPGEPNGAVVFGPEECVHIYPPRLQAK